MSFFTKDHVDNLSLPKGLPKPLNFESFISRIHLILWLELFPFLTFKDISKVVSLNKQIHKAIYKNKKNESMQNLVVEREVKRFLKNNFFLKNNV